MATNEAGNGPAATPLGIATELPPPASVSFFAELARRRRNAWGWFLLSLLIAGGVGFVLSSLVTPLLLLLVGLALKLLGGLGLVPAELSGTSRVLGRWAALQLAHFDALGTALRNVNGIRDLGATLAPLLALSSVAVPALVAAASVWLCLRGIASRAKGDVLVARLAARPIRNQDREERQLANIVEEMVIAAGIPAPRLLIVESPTVNAASFGRSHRDATLLVTRGLLDRLDRAETSAIVAHLVASVGEGDVGIANSVLALFHTVAFFLSFLDLPFRWNAWRALGSVVLLAVTPRPTPERIDQVETLLEESRQGKTVPTIEEMAARTLFPPKLAKIIVAPLLPLMLVNGLMKAVLFLWTAIFLWPPVSFLCRSRRYAADALAVQLTRDPEALARALARVGDVPKGGEGRAYLFVHAAAGAADGEHDVAKDLDRAVHPSIARRERRLAALGAAPEHGRRIVFSVADIGRHPGRSLLVGFLLLLLVPVGAALVVAIFYLTAIVMALVLSAGLAIAVELLGT